MLSFLHGLGKRSYHTPKSTIGSDSNESIPSRNGTVNASQGLSNAPSLTPPTSNTDDGSISTCTDIRAMPETQGRKSERLRHVRSSIGSYNENLLSGSAREITRRKNEVGDAQKWSGNTVIGLNKDEYGHSVEQRIQPLNPSLNPSSILGEDPNGSLEDKDTTQRRKSTRKTMVERAKSITEKTRSMLGKRSRETIETGINKMQNDKGATKDILQSGHSKTPPFEGPSKRWAQILDVSNSTFVSLSIESERGSNKRPRTKRWLDQGLYVGQDRDFDPRLTETKNRLKRLSDKLPNTKNRAILPLPMFAGQRTIEIGKNFKLPFDIFSPLPPGQPRPEEWKKTHKNVFIGDAASVWKKTKRLESSRCICTPDDGCDENCFNRFMFYECDSSNCNIGADFCTNRSFESLRQRTKAGGKYNVGVEVIKTLDRGHGVRSNRTFEPNEIIVEYTGEIITQDECDDRMHKRYKDSECYYLMDFDQHMILDATRGSIARFINHSCEPNCKMIKWTVAGKPRMALFAGDQGIMTGEELTYDYNFNPYSIKNVQECRCGASSCRGVLGPKPKEIRDALKPLTVGSKRKFQQTLQDSLETVTKKRKLALPPSAKNAVASARAKATKKLNQARVLASSSSNRRKRTVKKVSAKPSNGVTSTKIIQRTVNRVKRNPAVIYSRHRRRPSIGLSTRDQPKMDERPPGNGRENLKTRAASVRKDVVRTTRWSSRSTRAGAGTGNFPP